MNLLMQKSHLLNASRQDQTPFIGSSAKYFTPTLQLTLTSSASASIPLRYTHNLWQTPREILTFPEIVCTFLHAFSPQKALKPLDLLPSSSLVIPTRIHINI